MNGFFIWFSHVPLLLQCLMVFELIGFVICCGLGGFGEGQAPEKINNVKSFARVSIGFHVYFQLLGIFIVLTASFILGPYFALLYLLHWQDGIALLIGIPLGLLLTTFTIFVLIPWGYKKFQRPPLDRKTEGS